MLDPKQIMKNGAVQEIKPVIFMYGLLTTIEAVFTAYQDWESDYHHESEEYSKLFNAGMSDLYSAIDNLEAAYHCDVDKQLKLNLINE